MREVGERANGRGGDEQGGKHHPERGTHGQQGRTSEVGHGRHTLTLRRVKALAMAAAYGYAKPLAPLALT